MLEKLSHFGIPFGTTLTAIFGQGVPGWDILYEKGFAVFAACVAGIATYWLFKEYARAQKTRIEKLESEVRFYRDRYISHVERPSDPTEKPGDTDHQH